MKHVFSFQQTYGHSAHHSPETAFIRCHTHHASPIATHTDLFSVACDSPNVSPWLCISGSPLVACIYSSLYFLVLSAYVLSRMILLPEICVFPFFNVLVSRSMAKHELECCGTSVLIKCLRWVQMLLRSISTKVTDDQLLQPIAAFDGGFSQSNPCGRCPRFASDCYGPRLVEKASPGGPDECGKTSRTVNTSEMQLAQKPLFLTARVQSAYSQMHQRLKAKQFMARHNNKHKKYA